MRCFLGCFGGGKTRRSQKRDQARTNELALESAKHDHLNDNEEISKASVIPLTEICDEGELKCSQSPCRKRVTFDSKVKTHEHIVLQESVESLKRSKAGQSSFEDSEAGSNSSGLYPLNHRYKNCRESDDDEVEEDEFDGIESDLDEEEEYFSEVDKVHSPSKEDGLVAEDAKLRGVLNPVENLTQWNSAKFNGRTVQKQSQKENSNLISDQEDKRESFSFGEDIQIDDVSLSFKSKSKAEVKKPNDQELTVDTSLSTWLSKSETGSEGNSVSMETPTPDKNKPSCYTKRGITNPDDRPILCALTLEDIKHFSTTSTPRKSISKSPDDTPIIGTVGSYWGENSKADCDSTSSFKGIPNTTSKYREDKSVNWHSTPFEARLEKALNNRDN